MCKILLCRWSSEVEEGNRCLLLRPKASVSTREEKTCDYLHWSDLFWEEVAQRAYSIGEGLLQAFFANIFSILSNWVAGSTALKLKKKTKIVTSIFSLQSIHMTRTCGFAQVNHFISKSLMYFEIQNLCTNIYSERKNIGWLAQKWYQLIQIWKFFNVTIWFYSCY
jgi:hypothetical protein